MYTHKQIEILLQVAIKMLKEIRIPISDSISPEMGFPKAHSFYGQCCSKSSDRNKTKYEFFIRFSEYALCNSEKSIMNTLLHELLHTCPDCLNHGKLWQSYARKVKDTYGYDIKRCDGDKTSQDAKNLNKGLKRRKSHDVVAKIICPECGATWTRYRNSRLTLHPETYKCGICGHSLVRVF